MEGPALPHMESRLKRRTLLRRTCGNMSEQGELCLDADMQYLPVEFPQTIEYNKLIPVSRGVRKGATILSGML